MRRRVLFIVALFLASTILLSGAVLSRSAIAAYFDPTPHSCGGG
jgi:hypothetical protein